MKNAVQLFLAVTFVAFLAACSSGGSSRDFAEQFDYTGQGEGRVSDSVAGLGSANLTISQSGSNLTGAWQIAFDAGGGNSGSLLGIASDGAATIELYPSDPLACPYNVVATRSSSSMEGNYAAFNCTVSVSGTLSVTRR